MTDHEIVLQIQEWLDGCEWTCDTLPEIAALLASNGYWVADTKDRESNCAEVKAAHAADGAPLADPFYAKAAGTTIDLNDPDHLQNRRR